MLRRNNGSWDLFTFGCCLLGRLQSLGQKPSLKNCIESYPALAARKHIHSLLVVMLVEFLGHGFECVTLKNTYAWPCDWNEIVLPRLNQMPLPWTRTIYKVDLTTIYKFYLISLYFDNGTEDKHTTRTWHAPWHSKTKHPFFHRWDIVRESLQSTYYWPTWDAN